MTNFKTPTDFRRSLEARLKSIAVRSNQDLQRLRRKVAYAMLSTGHGAEFVFSILRLGIRNEGIGDLMIMWSEEADPDLKDEITFALMI